VSQDLLGHLKLRHKCNYDELIDRHENEDDILAKVLAMSKQDF